MTAEIALDPFDASHMEDAFCLWSDFETVKFTNWTHTPTRHECTQRMERVLSRYAAEPRHFGPYAIRSVSQGFVGIVGADLSDAALAEYEVWYILRREAWGKGIASRAVAELLERMIASGRVKRVKATAVTSNTASWRLLEKQGFTREGHVPGGHQKHGLSHDLFTYGKPL